jgi:hypothetical protein
MKEKNKKKFLITKIVVVTLNGQRQRLIAGEVTDDVELYRSQLARKYKRIKSIILTYEEMEDEDNA